MALKPLRPCAHPNCQELTRSVYCQKHKPKDSSRRSAAAVKWHRWYRLPIWTDRLRPDQLIREPMCRACAAEGIRTHATEVDHIIAHRGDWGKFADPTNLQSLCHTCHSRKTLLEMQNSAHFSNSQAP